jgi:hypothetical protein
MKAVMKVCMLDLILGLAVMVSMPAQAADALTLAGKVGFVEVSDNDNGMIRVYYEQRTSPANQAGCSSGDQPYVYIELKKEGRSTQELEQMLNLIYMSIATSRDVRMVIDGTRCSADGMRLLLGVRLNNL